MEAEDFHRDDFCNFFLFFFQAEDGIRDLTVTGVQTCALPISTFATPMARNPDCAPPWRTKESKIKSETVKGARGNADGGLNCWLSERLFPADERDRKSVV